MKIKIEAKRMYTSLRRCKGFLLSLVVFLTVVCNSVSTALMIKSYALPNGLFYTEANGHNGAGESDYSLS